MMTTMTNKKIYTAPTAEVFYLETENIIAASPTTDVPVYGGEEGGDGNGGGAFGDADFSNKKNPWQHTWE